MSIYRALKDSSVAAYAPNTAHLWRNVRSQQYGCRAHALQGMADENVINGGELTGGVVGSWDKIGELRIYVPAWCIGESGTTLKISAKIKRTVDSGLGHPVHIRLTHGSDTSNEASVNSTAWAWRMFEMTLSSVTGDSVVTIDVEAKTDDINSTAHFSWSRESAGSLLEAYE